jgi:hypothetical protein
VVGLYFKRRRFFDYIFSALFTVALLSANRFGLHLRTLNSTDFLTISLSIFSTAASLLGFVLAAATFLATQVRSAEFSILRNSRSYKDLQSLISSSLWKLFFLTAFSLLMSLVGYSKSIPLIAFFIFLAAITFMSLAALIYISNRVLFADARGS